MTIAILGRQPKLGLAELESVFGAEKVRPVGNVAAVVDTSIYIVGANEYLKEFGSVLKTANTITTLDTTDFNKQLDYIRRNLRRLIADLPEGKIKLGLSFYGFDIAPSKINASALSLKKIIKAADRSVRIVPNTETALSTAQTLHNQLTSPVGIELIFVRDGNKTLIGKATAVQDINAYTLRDRGRPKRDAFVGMLPPKLAQIMIHLSGIRSHGTLWDPFCGTGVLLQEALLMDHDVYGSDISEKMIDYTRQNLEWLDKKYGLYTEDDHDMWYDLRVGDATTIQFENKHTTPIDAIVCEGYLGQPMSQEPLREKLESIMHDCNIIMRDFLKNIAPQLQSGTRLCIGAPAWFVGNQIHHLPVLQKLTELGYERIEFTHASNEDLIYHREDQIVGRELVVLVKK